MNIVIADKGEESVRSDKRRTQDFTGMKYSPELIRQYEDPDYAREADRYEREARRQKHREEAERTVEGIFDDDRQEFTGSRRARAKQNSRRRRRNRNRSGRAGTDDGSVRSRSTQRPKKRYRVNKKTMAKNILVLVLLLAVVGTGAFYWLTRTFDTVETEKSAFAIDPQVEKDLSGYRNIAILGVDARADEGYDGSRTDAIIIMSIKKSTGDIRLISVMRDSYLRMEYFDGTPILDKITHAHHYTGAVNTCASLNQSLDLNIDEFIIFNWKAVADAVDCLGGVEINVKENEIGDMNIWGGETAANVGRPYEKITKAGVQTLDGVQATTYCRIRKNSGGDEGRSQRYKKVVAAVIKKAVLHPNKLDELSETVFPNVRTNMTQTGMLTAGVRAPIYDLGKSISWPRDYYSGLLNDGIAYVVPQTLESNVKRLHRLAFGQENYQISDTCREIHESIIYDTGIQ